MTTKKWLKTPVVSTRTLKSLRSSRGALLFRSECRSKAKKIAETKKAAVAETLSPGLAICCKPKIKATTVKNRVTMPIESGEYFSLLPVVSARTFQDMSAAAKATGKFAKKIHRQPTVSIKKPPNEGPVI